MSNLSVNSSDFLPRCYGIATAGYVVLLLLLCHVVLLLPLSVCVLVRGLRCCQRPRRAASSFSQFFTYNMAALELIGILGFVLLAWGILGKGVKIAWVGYMLVSFPWCGQMFLPVLTCVDRYVAVVHPIAYVRLRQRFGLRVRNLSAGCVWLLCCGVMGFISLTQNMPRYSFLLNMVLMPVFLGALVACSVPVLLVLTRPPPGDGGQSLSPAKQRAATTILLVATVLLVRFGGNLACVVVGYDKGQLFVTHTWCTATAVANLFNLPSSFVLPLLFLYNMRKLRA